MTAPRLSLSTLPGLPRCSRRVLGVTFVAMNLLLQAAAQSEFMPWGNLTGIRIDGEKVPFEVAVRAVADGTATLPLYRGTSQGSAVWYVVLDSSDGADADHVLRTQDYAVVLLDVSLPRMDGWEVLRRLRARGNHAPVLPTRVCETNSRVQSAFVPRLKPSEQRASSRKNNALLNETNA